jgi:protocatechuate 3,4-dioxygenase alpha subunit
MPAATPSQTIGPFFHVAIAPDVPAHLTPGAGPDAVTVEGRIFDGAGAPVADGLVEAWDEQGGFGRCATDPDGHYAFVIAATDHLSLRVFARGLLCGLHTRCYLHAAEDVPAGLVAAPTATGFRFDIHLQGDAETPFFAL